MSRYDTYTAGDDRKLEEQELGFKGFNDRLRPDQIQSGLLQKSENARLDLNGQWQSRKGVQNRLSPFAVSGTALRLPTEDEVTAGEIMLLSHTVSAATHSGGVVTLTTYNEATSAVDDHHLSVGDTIQVNNTQANIGGIIPSVGNYCFFVKNQIVNMASLIGYYANVKFENNSKNKVELFAVSAEVTESSK